MISDVVISVLICASELRCPTHRDLFIKLLLLLLEQLPLMEHLLLEQLPLMEHGTFTYDMTWDSRDVGQLHSMCFFDKNVQGI